jgi:hypothetical protein
MGATIAAAAAASARRQAEANLLERFRVADATAPGRAQTLSQLGLGDSLFLDRFLSAGVIRQDPGGGGRYYLDEVAFAAYRRQRQPNLRTMAAVLCLAGAAIIIGVVMFLAQRTG